MLAQGPDQKTLQHHRPKPHEWLHQTWMATSGLPPRHNDMRFRSILIVTYGRSGSTLLQGILNTLPNTVVRGENHDFCWGLYLAWRSLSTSRSRFGKKTAEMPSHPWFGANQLSPEKFLEGARQLLVEQLNLPPNQDEICWGFKEIRYLEHLENLPDYLDFLGRLLPAPAFVFNTRSHEEVAASAFMQKKDAIYLSAQLRAADRLFMEFAEVHQNAFVMRYERLCQGWDACSEFFDFLGARPERAVFEKTISTPHSYQQRRSTLATAASKRASICPGPHIPDGLELLTDPNQASAAKASAAKVIVFCEVTNERSKLPQFLNHYRRLGCSSFVFLDNGSVDGTVALLLQQPDTVVYSRSTDGLATSGRERGWLEGLVRAHVSGRWALIADVDELLFWTNCEEESLAGLAARATRMGLSQVFTPVLNAYYAPAADASQVQGQGHLVADVLSLIGPTWPYGVLSNKNRPLSFLERWASRHTPWGESNALLIKHSLFLVQPCDPLDIAPPSKTCFKPSPLVVPFLRGAPLPDLTIRAASERRKNGNSSEAANLESRIPTNFSARAASLADSEGVRRMEYLKGYIAAITWVIRQSPVRKAGSAERILYSWMRSWRRLYYMCFDRAAKRCD